jgi:hypothetical protein
MAPRALENELQEQPARSAPLQPRRIGHLLVYDSGCEGAKGLGSGPLGRPTPVATGGRRSARSLH